MKYTKGNQSFNLDTKDCTYIKTRFNDGTGGETPWAFKSNSTQELFNANQVLHLLPFPSWGCKIPASNMGKSEIEDLSDERELHPDAWDEYIKNKIIDKEGNFLKNP